MDHIRFGAAYSPYARVTAARWLFYPHLRLQRDFGNSSAAQAAAEPYVWSDALELSNALCCELALGTGGATAAAAHYMLSAILSPDFESAASDAVDGMRLYSEGLRAEVSAAQGALESAQMAGDHLSSSEAYAAAAATESAHAELEAAIQQISELLVELASWRLFFQLDRRMANWSEEYDALQAGSGSPGNSEALTQQAEELLNDMTEQLLKGDWMAWEGAPKLGPQEQHFLKDIPACTVDLVVTTKSDGHKAEASQALTASRQPFLGVKGAELYELEVLLRSALASVTSVAMPGTGRASSREGVQAQVAAPQEAEGFVTVSLSCALGSTKAWQAMVSLAVSIVHRSLPGVPQVYVVNMRASRPASMAICRQCCLGQAVMHCSALRHALTVLGGDGKAGEELATLLAKGTNYGKIGGLASVLSPAMLQGLLKAEAATTVQMLWNEQQEQQRQCVQP